jgi:DDE superfamily endonuclease
MFDTFARGIYNGDNALKDVVFELFERDSDGNVITVTYNGCYVIVDNGYLSWSTTVPPTKSPLTQKELRWSEWLESLRKDVECTFGILKGRWRILKTGIRLHGVNAPDKVWLTCCALHNWLLEIDGLDVRWEAGVSSDWEGELGQLNGNDVEQFASSRTRAPFAIQRLHSVLAGDEVIARYRNYDTSGMGPGNEGDSVPQNVRLEEPDPNENASIYEATENGVRAVRKLSLEYFKGRLIEHFDIMWQKKQIVWPRRLPQRYNPNINA